jgi:uncharacterized protein (UPF0264 family)
VAVSYADWRKVAAPAPEQVIETGRRIGCAGWLIDTFDKRGGWLLDHVRLDELASWTNRANELGMFVVYAGSLTADAIEMLLPLQPDYVAVRGAACAGGRQGTIDPRLVRELAVRLQGRRL